MSRANVAIVDCGGANIASLTNALSRLNAETAVTNDADEIRNASHVVIPGVGNAANAMQQLRSNDLADVIVHLEQPVLGICLGMQLLARYSAEDETQCLNVVPASADKLVAQPQLPVPNIGWCRVNMTRPHRLLKNVVNDSYFYFVHSYALPCGSYTLATAVHQEPFTAILERNNFFATQFHPEKSAASGARVLENFLELNS